MKTFTYSLPDEIVEMIQALGFDPNSHFQITYVHPLLEHYKKRLEDRLLKQKEEKIIAKIEKAKKSIVLIIDQIETPIKNKKVLVQALHSQNKAVIAENTVPQ